MSLKKILVGALVYSVLQLGALSGVKMSPEEIEKLMNLMHRIKVVKVVKHDGK